VCRLPTANEEGGETKRNIHACSVVPALAAPFGNSQPESFFPFFFLVVWLLLLLSLHEKKCEIDVNAISLLV
jgi:hypothetical protein